LDECLESVPNFTFYLSTYKCTCHVAPLSLTLSQPITTKDVSFSKRPIHINNLWIVNKTVLTQFHTFERREINNMCSDVLKWNNLLI